MTYLLKPFYRGVKENIGRRNKEAYCPINLLFCNLQHILSRKRHYQLPATLNLNA